MTPEILPLPDSTLLLRERMTAKAGNRTVIVVIEEKRIWCVQVYFNA